MCPIFLGKNTLHLLFTLIFIRNMLVILFAICFSFLYRNQCVLP
uniref:Uncharacterized protein n=1 Tax=Rhizophora mucronata TaxID=61149 RepID=A0A2P2NKP9_RHIMU